MDPGDVSEPCKNQYGILKFNTGSSTTGNASEYSKTGQYSSLSFANPVYEPRGSGVGPSYKVEDVVLQDKNLRKSSGKLKGFKSKKEKPYFKNLNLNDNLVI